MKYFKPLRWRSASDNIETDKEMRLKLMGDFVKDNKNKYSEIKKALSSGDIKLAHRLAHTLKGSASHFGKTFLQQIAADLEYNLKDGRNNVKPEQMPMLKAELKAVLSQFTAELEANPVTQHKPQKPGVKQFLTVQSALELIAKLEPLLKKGDPECLKFMDALGRVPCSDDATTGTLVTHIIQQIEDFDFEHAFFSLAELKEILNKQITEE
jgi:HPt (histidine-containing phosphotransfer) domain-containing protein